MSSIPPTPPPGGGAPPPYPPYDPKTQWKVYRAQQRAAWKAQREAWKAQHYAWKASYIGTYGPRVPSVVGPILLIAIGVIALLVLTGRIAGGDFWAWYGHWWPLLLIGAGLAMLGEWAIDLRRETPVRRGGSFVGILILLAFLGFGAAGWNNFWGPFHNHWGNQGDDFFNIFGLPEHDFDQHILSSQLPANAAIEIQNPRGDVSITAGDGSTVEVQAHEVAFANSDADAKKIFDAEAARVTVSGSAVLIKSESNTNGRLNLTVTVPKTAKVTVDAGRGDVVAAGLGAGVAVTAEHGDVHLSAIAGSVLAHLSNGKHDFSAHQVDGDLTTDGDVNDFTLSEIKGKVTQNGEILGDVHLEEVAGPVHLHTSVTDLQVAELPGDLTLNSDDLRVTEAKGQVRVVTHSKDVDLSQISGDTYVEDRDGRVSVEPAGNFSVDAKNSKGDVEVTLAPGASATVDGRTRNGDIFTEFALPIAGDENKTVSGKIGSGGSRIILGTDNGDLRIKKGSGFPATPPAAAAEAAPKAPHLTAPKALPAQPVTQ
ncbi:MAG: DUF4097 family beta strand repeat-containing protein [Terracidiphilus sp.]|jgi:DUF4097 and DUF4098 domain-containing protein YvlB